MSPPAGEIRSEQSDEYGYLGSGERPAPPPLPPINIINYASYRINGSWSRNHEIVEEEEEEDGGEGQFGGRKLMDSITEEYDEDKGNDLFSSSDGIQSANDVVYVVAWRGNEELSSASMDALAWTVSNAVQDSSIVYLVHVFPELRYIPTPLGRLPISQANPEQKESYMSQERSKRSEYLQRFLQLCSSSKVNVETVLIESDMEAKAILDLIPILNIRKLVLGTTKSNLRKMKTSSKKGGGSATIDQILHNAPDFCDIKIICQGKEVSVQDHFTTDSPSPSSTPRATDVHTMQVQQDQTNGFVRCSCFKL